MARGQFVPPSAWVMTFVVWPRNLHNLVRWTFRRIFQTFYTGCNADGGGGNYVMTIVIVIIIIIIII